MTASSTPRLHRGSTCCGPRAVRIWMLVQKEHCHLAVGLQLLHGLGRSFIINNPSLRRIPFQVCSCLEVLFFCCPDIQTADNMFNASHQRQKSNDSTATTAICALKLELLRPRCYGLQPVHPSHFIQNQALSSSLQNVSALDCSVVRI